MKRKHKKFGFTPLEIEVSNLGSDGASKRFLTGPVRKDVRKDFSNGAGFTMVELLTVLGIIALLVALLLPSLSMVRKIARETQQKAQFSAIDFTLMTFKSDYGDYPWSDQFSHYTGVSDYCGAQKLAEALLGWDLLGFHPDSAWRADGLDKDDGQLTYDPPNPGDDSLSDRIGPYLELATANAFTLRQLFGKNDPGWGNPINSLEEDRYVLCDVFAAKKITLIQPGPERRTVTFNAGTPILYYRANTASKKFLGGQTNTRIYDSDDNYDLIDLKSFVEGTEDDDLLRKWDGRLFYDYNYKIIDPKVTAKPWPHRPDSYILISAGADGLYGTADDITNF